MLHLSECYGELNEKCITLFSTVFKSTEKNMYKYEYKIMCTVYRTGTYFLDFLQLVLYRYTVCYAPAPKKSTYTVQIHEWSNNHAT